MDEEEARRAGLRVSQLRTKLGWSRGEFSRRSGLSKTYISDFEHGREPHPRPLTQRALATALGWPSFAELVASDALDPPDGGATARLPTGSGTMPVRNRPESDGDGPAVPGGAGLQPYRGMPVFRYGTVGDPLAASGAPAPHDQVMLKEELVREGARVGPRGWGVLLMGSELSGWRMPDGARLVAGWSVFCNPDAAEGVPPEAWEGRLVIGRDLGGEAIVGQLVRAPDAEGGLGMPWAAATYRAGVPAERQQRRRLARIYGPVIWQQGPGYPESGPDGEGGAA